MAERKQKQVVQIFVATLLVFVLSSCGGGGGGTTGGTGGGGGTSGASISGSFHAASYGVAATGGSGWNEVSIGLLSASGSGTYSFSGVYNRGATNQPFSYSGTCSDIGSNGDFSLLKESSTYDGFMNQSKDVYIAANVRVNDNQAILFGVKAASSGMSEANLSGKYWLVEFGKIYTSAALTFGNVVFNGAGRFSDNFTANNVVTGIITNSDFNISYSVTPNGALNMGGKLIGGVNQSGDIFIIEEDGSSGYRAVGVGIKAGPSSGYSNASLNGTFKYFYNEEDSSTYPSVVPDAETNIGTCVFNGLGTWTMTGRMAMMWNPGPSYQPVSATGTYSVNPDGTLTMTKGSYTLDGAISNTGDELIMANIRNSSRQTVIFLIK